MFHRCPALHYREAADDLFQQAMLRLWQALANVQPTTVGRFMGLAAHEMRWALGDLARRHFGRNPDSADAGPKRPVIISNSGRRLNLQASDSTWAPDELACWSEFHAAADRLAEPVRTAFDLLYYHELSHAEVAELMQVSERRQRPLPALRHTGYVPYGRWRDGCRSIKFDRFQLERRPSNT